MGEQKPISRFPVALVTRSTAIRNADNEHRPPQSSKKALQNQKRFSK
jgi:hypothetical protein